MLVNIREHFYAFVRDMPKFRAYGSPKEDIGSHIWLKF